MSARSAAQRVGRYAMHDEISSGGMATVYFGKLVGPVGFSRAVAIKRLHPHLAKDPEFVAMFLDEARLASRIRHPNVVPTLDVVSIPADSGSELFLVMEYVQGEPLHRLLRRVIERGEKIPSPIVASIFAGTLHGLHAAHETKDEKGKPLGIVHRDISPHNIMVGVDGVARLLDFGVAKATGRLQMTREGHLKGKLAYMAPEQIESGAVNRLSDIYAAGVVLWEALCARRLFDADTEGQLVTKIMQGNIEPPSSACPGLPQSFDDITLRALDKDPARRFQSAREMAIALERSGPLSPASELGEWVERIAREELGKRAAKLAEMESGVHEHLESQRPMPVARSSAASAPERDARPERAPRPEREDATIVARKPKAAPPGKSDATPTSTPNLGTARQTPPTPPTSMPPSTAKAQRRRILVIDDSEVMLQRIKQALVTAGYEVTTTTRAVGNARHLPTSDLVIIDFHMPGIDGGTVISSLRNAATSLNHPCLFYLYTSDSAVARDYEKLGFDGVFRDKGSQETLVREVNALFRMLKMRAMKKS